MFKVDEFGVVTDHTPIPSPIVLSHAYSPSGGNSSGLLCVEPGLTQQQFKDEVDIKVLVDRFGIGYKPPEAGIRQPVYGDFTEVGDYRAALDAINSAEAAFNALSGEVRQRFDHDPQKFMEFCSEASNAEEMNKLGLLDPAAYARTQARLKEDRERVAREVEAAALAAAAARGWKPPTGG